MIVARTVTVFDAAMQPTDVTVLHVHLLISAGRSVAVPLDVFLALVDKAPSFRQLGIELDNCADDFEVTMIAPAKAKAMAAA